MKPGLVTLNICGNNVRVSIYEFENTESNR